MRVTKFPVVNGTVLTIVVMQVIVPFFGIMRLGTGRTLIHKVIDQTMVGITQVEDLGDFKNNLTMILNYYMVLMVVQYRK